MIGQSFICSLISGADEGWSCIYSINSWSSRATIGRQTYVPSRKNKQHCHEVQDTCSGVNTSSTANVHLGQILLLKLMHPPACNLHSERCLVLDTSCARHWACPSCHTMYPQTHTQRRLFRKRSVEKTDSGTDTHSPSMHRIVCKACERAVPACDIMQPQYSVYIPPLSLGLVAASSAAIIF